MVLDLGSSFGFGSSCLAPQNLLSKESKISPGEAGAAGRGEQGASGHLPWFPLAAGGAKHHRSAWEISGDAERLWLRRFYARGHNQHSVCRLTSPAFMSARCQLCPATTHCSGLCSQGPDRASTLPKHLTSFLGSPLLCP